MLGIEYNLGFDFTMEFLETLVKELDLASAAFVFDGGRGSKSFSLMIRNKSNLVKMIYFGEEDKKRNLITDVLPEIKTLVESQKW